MQNYEGCSCPVCKKPLLPSDDIVVCPDCGAPYHRACYQQRGACVFAEMHGTGFEWKRPASAPQLDKCPNCGTPYPQGRRFCEKCGAALDRQEPTQVPPSRLGRTAENFSLPFDFFSEEDMTGEIDGIPVADWAAYIGPSAPYYLYQFKRMDATGHKVGFVFSAAFFAPIYFFYRKMWALGLLSAVVNLLFKLPAAAVMLSELGIFFALPFSYATLNTVATVCSVVLSLLQVICWGMFGAWFYRRHCARHIRKIQASTTDPAAYQAQLRKRGGPSKIFLVLLFVFYALMTIWTFWLVGAF